MRHQLQTSDFLLAFSAIVAGMALTFVSLASWSASYKVLVILLSSGVALTCLSLRSKTRKHERETSVCKETVLVDSEASAEVVFAPASAMVNPVLHLTAHGRPVMVEDVWHDDVSLVVVPTPIIKWRRGVEYAGVVDSRRTLKIIVRNTGYAPAVVRASLSARKKR